MGHHHEHTHGEHCDHSHEHKQPEPKHHHGHHHHSHDHDHSHGHHHHFDIQELSFKLVLGAALNFIFVGVEAAAGFYFDSVALLADASHNLSDAGSLLLALLAFHWAKIPASASHNFGYQKTTILAALFNSALLVAALCVLAYQSVGRFWQLPTAVFGLETAAVAGLGIVINSATAFLLLSNQKDDLNLRGAYLHMIADALVSLGVLLSGVLVYFTQWAWVDAVVSLGIVLLLFRSSWALLAQSWRLALGAVPDGISWDKVKSEIQQLAHIDKVLELQIWALSSSENAANLKISFQDGSTISQIAQVQHQIQHLLEHHQIQKSNIEIVFHTQKTSH